MKWVLITHEVDDYGAWKAVFDEASELRRAAGEREFFVLCSESDSHKVVHFSRWVSLEAARAFFESPELARIRERAGVRAPEFSYLDELERGVLPG